ncbi:hypothetical protein C7399_11287 [Paraburkholderia tropica]|uniref:Uncharacterized protein n=1 Tax=Paraburkholderia tropica TaxID=92647 RepID=A0ABX5MLE1_9BURK|nr:hypothetical protein C7400_11287 [Paraburkholderia tropica]PZW79543.1 hypothetical protein C7399_11287 [Paraburkholderia tropica]
MIECRRELNLPLIATFEFARKNQIAAPDFVDVYLNVFVQRFKTCLKQVVQHIRIARIAIFVLLKSQLQFRMFPRARQKCVHRLLKENELIPKIEYRKHTFAGAHVLKRNSTQRSANAPSDRFIVNKEHILAGPFTFEDVFYFLRPLKRGLAYSENCAALSLLCQCMASFYRCQGSTRLPLTDVVSAQNCNYRANRLNPRCPCGAIPWEVGGECSRKITGRSTGGSQKNVLEHRWVSEFRHDHRSTEQTSAHH